MLVRFPVVGGFKKCLILAGIAWAGMGIASKAKATTIFTQAQTQNLQTSTRSEITAGQQAADDFVLSSDNTVMSVHWWGNYVSGVPATPSFRIRFFLDDGSGLRPANSSFYDQSPSFLQRTLTSFDTDAAGGSNDVYDFQANLVPSPSLSLTSGTKYYISIVDTSAGDWKWSAQSVNGAWQRGDDNSTIWSSTGINMYFELSNTAVPVPTPSALGAGLLLLAAMGLTAKYARKAKGRI